jgi:hypothetical protein
MQLHANLQTSAYGQISRKRLSRPHFNTSLAQPIKNTLCGPSWLRNAPCERGLVACYASEDELHETKLGPNVASGIKEVKEKLTWSPATVMRNECAQQCACWLAFLSLLTILYCRAVNLNGTHRLLHLSVSDEVRYAFVACSYCAALALRRNDLFFFAGGHALWQKDPGSARHCEVDRVFHSKSSNLSPCLLV